VETSWIYACGGGENIPCLTKTRGKQWREREDEGQHKFSKTEKSHVRRILLRKGKHLDRRKSDIIHMIQKRSRKKVRQKRFHKKGEETENSTKGEPRRGSRKGNGPREKPLFPCKWGKQHMRHRQPSTGDKEKTEIQKTVKKRNNRTHPDSILDRSMK